jgi:hypothetical protein
LLSLGRISNTSLYRLSALTILLASLSYITLPIRLPTEPSTSLFYLYIPSTSISLIPFMLFAISTVFANSITNRGRELN